MPPNRFGIKYVLLLLLLYRRRKILFLKMYYSIFVPFIICGSAAWKLSKIYNNTVISSVAQPRFSHRGKGIQENVQSRPPPHPRFWREYSFIISGSFKEILILSEPTIIVEGAKIRKNWYILYGDNSSTDNFETDRLLCNIIRINLAIKKNSSETSVDAKVSGKMCPKPYI